MKQILSLFLFLLPAIAFLQPSKDKDAPYFKAKGYPEINLLLTDSTTVFTKQNLPKDKIVVIIFFSPECEHCQDEAAQLTQKADSVANLFMVWNANMVDDFNNVKTFYNKYEFSKLNNVVMGKEINYYLPLFYKIENTPYAAVYKNEKLFAEFRNTLNIENLIAIANNTYVPPPVLIETTPAKKNVKKTKKKLKR